MKNFLIDFAEFAWECLQAAFHELFHLFKLGVVCVLVVGLLEALHVFSPSDGDSHHGLHLHAEAPAGDGHAGTHEREGSPHGRVDPTPRPIRRLPAIP
jgi:hypothetical protein